MSEKIAIQGIKGSFHYQTAESYAHYDFTKVENPLYKQVNNLFVRFFMVGVKPCWCSLNHSKIYVLLVFTNFPAKLNIIF